MKPHYCHVTLENYMDHKAFEWTLTNSNQESINSILENDESNATRNICVKVHHTVADELTNVCNALGMQKSTVLRLAIDQVIEGAMERIGHVVEDNDAYVQDAILEREESEES